MLRREGNPCPRNSNSLTFRFFTLWPEHRRTDIEPPAQLAHDLHPPCLWIVVTRQMTHNDIGGRNTHRHHPVTWAKIVDQVPGQSNLAAHRTLRTPHVGAQRSTPTMGTRSTPCAVNSIALTLLLSALTQDASRRLFVHRIGSHGYSVLNGLHHRHLSNRWTSTCRTLTG